MMLRRTFLLKFIALHQRKRINSQRFLSSNNENHLQNENYQDLKYYNDFKKYLKTNKYLVKDGHTCLHVECRLCDRRQSKAVGGGGGKVVNSIPMAYINKRTGAFLCPTCDINQSIQTVMRVYETGQHLTENEFTYSTHCQMPATKIDETLCEELKVRGVRPSDLEAANAKLDEKSRTLYFPLKNAANKIVGEKILHLNDKLEFTIPENSSSGILIYGPVNKSKAILVTNVIDYLVLVMQRIETHCIVCLPYGLKSLPQECLPALERFKELIFWFNFDSTGWDAARGFASKMDLKRCFLIRPTDTTPSPSESHRKRLNIRHILQKATPVSHKSITTFNALRSDILSELQNIEKVHGVKWKRFPILNKLLKGHRKGELTIITGPTGSGKTTFMSEYSLDLALQGVSTLWGSFEIRNTRLASTLLRQYVGYSLENKLHEFEHWATEFEKYPLYFMTFHGQQPLKIVMEAIEHAQYIYDINHVIIDNLQFMMGVSMTHRSDKFYEQDTIIAAFRGFATKHNVHVTLVMHPRKERVEEDLTTNSVFGTAKATQEADNVLIIQDKRLTSLRGKRYLQVVKNRYTGDLGIMPLEFDKDSLSYAVKKKKDKEKLDKDESQAAEL